jgi:hypothetical protein
MSLLGTMASADVQDPQVFSHFLKHLDDYEQHSTPVTSLYKAPKAPYETRNLTSTFNYFKDNEDGSPPAPNYVGKPES